MSEFEPLRAEPVLPEHVPVDAFCCAVCGATLYMLGQGPVVHDCSTGEVSPA